jgi:hypothetical protein
LVEYLFGDDAPMKRLITLTFALLAVLTAFLGCSRIVTGGYTDSKNGKYRCWMRQFGPYNYALIERYTIRIRVVEIIDKTTNWIEKPLFTREYRFKHPYVQIEPSWDKDDNLRIVLYDYGTGVSPEAALKAGSPSNLLATVSLTMDKTTGKYHEQK